MKVTVWLKRYTFGFVCGRIAAHCILGQGGFAVQQVQDIAVRVREEGQGVAIGGLGIRKKRNALLFQAGIDRGEIGDREGEVAEAAAFMPWQEQCRERTR